MPEEFDVFLSHNSRDKPVVEEIAGHLRGKGLRVWLDKDELRPGFPWQEGLEEGVRASRSVAVFVGADGIGVWQEPEMRAFLARSKREKIPVIPVLLPGCPDSPQLSLFLEALTWVDLRQGLSDDGLARLLWGITGTKGENVQEFPTVVRGPRERPRRFSRWSWGIVLALLGVLLTLAIWFWPHPPRPLPLPVRPPMYAVRVQVFDPKGLPVSGATIRVSTLNEPQRTPEGWWEVEIPAAKVPADGWITLRADHPAWRGTQKTLLLGTDPNVGVEIHLDGPESWLRGQVVDESGRAVADAQVSLQNGPRGETRTNSQGNFEFKLPVPPETSIRVRAEHEGLTPDAIYCFAGRDTCSISLEKP